MFAKSPLAVDKHLLKCLSLSSLLLGEGVAVWWFLGLQNLQSLPDYINCACSRLQKKSYTRQNLNLQLFECTPRLYSKELSALYQNSSCICSVQSRNLSKWVTCPAGHFKLGHFQNGLGQTMILKLWTTDIWTTSPALLPSLSSWSSCFWGWTPIIFCAKNELSFCCCFIMKWKQKNANKWSVNQSAKQRMWKVQMYPPVSPGMVWNDAWHKN